MALYVAVPLVLAAALFQSALPQAGPLAGLKPDLVLVVALTGGVLLSWRQGLFLAFLGGLVLDLFSSMPFGFVTLALLLAASLARLPNRDLLEANPLVCMLVVALATLLYYGTYSLGILTLRGELDWLRLASTAVLPAVVMNSLLSPLFYGLFSLLGRKAVPLREDWQ